MPASPHFIFTTSIFKVPAQPGFDAALIKHLLGKLGAPYFDENTLVEDKWDRLMTAFSNALPVESRPQLQHFQEKRKRVVVSNKNVLQLKQLLTYLEQYYFIYTDTSLCFSVSQNEKQRLLQHLLEVTANDICDVGIITRLENGLQEVKKDSDWVSNQLHKYRQLITHQIGDEYNAINQVHISLTSHTLMKVSTLAEHAGFGVVAQEEIADAYLSSDTQQHITRYFNRVLPQKIQEYKQNIIRNLSQHMLFDVREFLLSKELDLSTWDESSIQLTDEQLTQLTFFIRDVLNDDLRILGSYDDEMVHFSLHNKHNVYKAITVLVQNKLLATGYAVSLANINRHTPDLDHLLLPAGITPEKLVEFIEVISEYNNTSITAEDFLSRYQDIFIHFPSLIAAMFVNHPSLWLRLPRQLKNNIVIADALIAELDTLLQDVEDHSVDQSMYFDMLWTVVKSNPDFLNNLSAQVINNKSFALKLVAKDGMLLSKLSRRLQKDADIVSAANAQNSNALFVIDNMELADYYKQQLREAPFVSIGRLVRLAQWLTPIELRQIVILRRENQLPPLPNCNAVSLEQFGKVVNSALWQAQGYLAVKRQLPLQSVDVKAGIANQCINESNQWFLAYMAFDRQVPAFNQMFISLSDLLMQLKQSMQGLYLLVKSITTFLVNFGKKLLWLMLLAMTTLLMLEIVTQIAEWFIFNVLVHLGPFADLVLYLQFYVFIYIIQMASDYLQLNINMNDGLFLCVSLGVSLLFLFFLPLHSLMVVNCIETVYLFVCAIVLLAKLVGTLFNQNWLVNNAQEIVLQGLSQLLLAQLHIYMHLIHACFKIVEQVADQWLPMLVESLLPLVTRTWATLTAKKITTPSGDDAIIMDVENSIFRLLSMDEPSAVMKGDILNDIWQAIQKEASATEGKFDYAKSLIKKYVVLVDGKKEQLSFREVSDTVRTDKNVFKVNTPDTRFNFFGLRGKTTTRELTAKHACAEPDKIPMAC